MTEKEIFAHLNYGQGKWPEGTEEFSAAQSVTVTPPADDLLPADAKQYGGTHYRDMPVQPWTVMESILSPVEFKGFLKGNIIKYSMRVGKKDEHDGNKLKHYMQKLAEVTSPKQSDW